MAHEFILPTDLTALAIDYFRGNISDNCSSKKVPMDTRLITENLDVYHPR